MNFSISGKSGGVSVCEWLFCMLLIGTGFPAFAQYEVEQDSILQVNLEEVILIASRRQLEYQKQPNPLATLDTYLDNGHSLGMMKRGAYAWEPMINGMASERLAITIDGMRIFSGCTDKMDPVTSYVDISNLKQAKVSSGQGGAEHGSTIGGSLDLQLDKSGYGSEGLRANLESGLESNNMQRIAGAELNYSGPALYVDGDFIYRKAENYTAGGGEEVPFSQFEKSNLSVNAGHKMDANNELAATLIYDEARNVGYPALPMDVSLARGIIAAVDWKAQQLGRFQRVRTKAYFNTITHVMDDSQRPDVPIRMDMPGWSDTYGFLTEGFLDSGRHVWQLKWDGFYNRSLAEMTMYPVNTSEPAMFMLTWPDVRTWYTGVFGEDTWALGAASLKLGARISVQENTVADYFGLNSLRIFYPEMEAGKTRVLKSVSAGYRRPMGNWTLSGGVAYGDRAPSVSEGYGFYLFNSFDNHDYIGNPGMKNEASLETSVGLSWENDGASIGLEGNYFYLPNYIVGEIDPSLSPMTIGADGVKLYRNLAYATQYNAVLRAAWKLSPQLRLEGNVSYHRGYDHTGRNLPFISPLAYDASVSYSRNGFSGSVQMRGAGEQSQFSPEFGEDRTRAYTVFSMSLGKVFALAGNDQVYVKGGVQNVFDAYYTTYSDWNNIPRMGRNLYASLTYKLN